MDLDGRAAEVEGSWKGGGLRERSWRGGKCMGRDGSGWGWRRRELERREADRE